MFNSILLSVAVSLSPSTAAHDTFSAVQLPTTTANGQVEQLKQQKKGEITLSDNQNLKVTLTTKGRRIKI